MNKRRSRFVIGLVLLAALTFSFIESAAAAMCTPASDMSGMQAMHDTGAPAAQHGDRGDDPDQRPGGDCPFTAGAAQGCASASLPAAGIRGVAALATGTADLTHTQIEPHLILAALVFHPPKF